MIKLDHLPLDQIVVSSLYGQRNMTLNGKHYWWHNGLDLKANLNTPLYAVAGGTVKAARYDNSYGYYLALDHGKFGTLYSHLSRYIVSEGSKVSPGQIIAYSGNTGDSTGPHLHFEIRLATYDKFWERANCDRSVFMNTTDPMPFIEDYLDRQREISVDEAISIVQSSAGLEDKTMEYMVRHYRFGDDLVKKLAQALV